MKLSLSKSVKLDGTYTNHSIRATVITTLDRQGFEAHHIIQLSSHKSESTVKEYSTKCPENKRKEMFDSLTNAMQPKNKKCKPSGQPALANIDINDIKHNLPTFDLEVIDDFETIDDTLLVDILNETIDKHNNENSNNNNNQLLTSAPPPIVPQINTQVINNNNNAVTKTPPSYRVPQMYFPHSNVTINYNFGK